MNEGEVELNEEKEALEEFETDEDYGELGDFVELSDLEEYDSVSGEELFGELGDLADLGNVMEEFEKEASASEPVMAEEIPVPEEPVIPETPIVSEESIMPEEPVELEEPILPEEPLELEEPILPEEPLELEEPILPEEPVELEEMLEPPLPDMSEEETEESDPLWDLPKDFFDGESPLPDLTEEEPELPDVAMEADDAGMPELPTEDILPDFNEEIAFQSVEPAQDVPDIFDDDNMDIFTEGEQENAASLMGALDELSLSDGMSDIGEDFGEDIPDEIGVGLDLSEADTLSDEEALAGSMDDISGDLDMSGEIEEPVEEEPMNEEEVDVSDIFGMDDDAFEESDIGSMEELDVSGMIPKEEQQEEPKEKEPGFFKKVFGNVVTDEIAEQERQEAQAEEEAAAKKAEEDAKAKEEAEALKAEKKAAKEAQKEEKKKEKEAKKAEKAAQKAEKKAKREEEEAKELEVVGKLNKVGVSIIAIVTILFLTIEIAGTNLFSYASTKREALNYFEMGKYTEAYQEAMGTDMREKDEEEYNKIKVVMRVQQSLNAYQNYDRVQYYPEALDALLRGIKRYDANIAEAIELEVDTDMESCRRQILTLLQEEFNLSEQEAYTILAMDKEDYQNRVVELGVKRKFR